MGIGDRIRDQLLKPRIVSEYAVHQPFTAVVPLAIGIHDDDYGIRKRLPVSLQIAKEVLQLTVHAGQTVLRTQEPRLDACPVLIFESPEQCADELFMEGVLAEERNLRHQNRIRCETGNCSTLSSSAVSRPERRPRGPQ